MPAQGCPTCKHSRWHLSVTGRIGKGHAGHCVVPIVLPPLPSCVRNEVHVSRMGIWPDDGGECPLYELNPGKPISETQRG